jgi:hypothetical protein
LLAGDAALRAAEGITKERWVSGVLEGHAGDDTAQVGCLSYIIRLWNEGPWPWPRETEDSEVRLEPK